MYELQSVAGGAAPPPAGAGGDVAVVFGFVVGVPAPLLCPELPPPVGAPVDPAPLVEVDVVVLDVVVLVLPPPPQATKPTATAMTTTDRPTIRRHIRICVPASLGAMWRNRAPAEPDSIVLGFLVRRRLGFGLP